MHVIYKISFNNTDKVYIGRTSNYKSRNNTHIWALKNNCSTKKLQEAYNQFGEPSIDILEENILDEEISAKEKYYILKYNSVEDGYNTTYDTTQGGGGRGELSSGALYRDYEILNLIKYIVENKHQSLPLVSKNTGINFNTVEGVAQGKTYTWLEECIPELYKELLSIKGTRKLNLSKTIKFISPDGTVHYSTNIRDFCKKHNLNQSAMSKVSRGIHTHHHGWTLSTE